MLIFQIVKADQSAMEGHVLAAEADVAAPDAAEAQELGGDEGGGVAGGREAQSLSGEDDGGIDADDFSLAADERSAAVAGV